MKNNKIAQVSFCTYLRSHFQNKTIFTRKLFLSKTKIIKNNLGIFENNIKYNLEKKSFENKELKKTATKKVYTNYSYICDTSVGFMLFLADKSFVTQ